MLLKNSKPFLKTHCQKIVLALMMMVPLLVFAQVKTITGTIKDDAGKPVKGVSVTVKNENTGTQTDALGRFTLKAPTGATVVVSIVGYEETQIIVGPRNTYDVFLKQTNNTLSDVVVIGYGTQKKTSVSGSVSIVEGKALENRPINNTLQGLQGLAPGMIVTRSSGQPGAEGWNINIRGISSLNGTNSPLLIVDGVEYADLNMLNPNDIASFSILKDAAAAAIYGAKAANGVVLVTTKKGTAGKIKVNYTGQIEVQNTLSLPHKLHSWEIAEIQNIAAANAGASPTWSAPKIQLLKDSVNAYIPNDPNLQYFYGDYDYVAMSVKPTYTSSNQNINVSGGNDKTQYFIGLGYNSNNGMFRFGPDENKRYNGRINLTTKFNNVLSLDSRLSFTQNKVSLPAVGTTGDNGLLYNLMAIRPFNPVYVPGSNNTQYFNGTATTTIANMKEGGYNNNIQNLMDGVFTLKAEHLVKGLVLSANYSPRLQQDNQDVFVRTIPTYGFDATNKVFLQNTFINQTNSIRKVRTTQKTVSTNALADYSYTILNDHHFHALAGFQYQYYNFNQVSASQSNLLNNDLPTLNYTSNVTVSPSFSSDNIQANAWVSYFGKLGYDYKNKYFIEGTLRNDASSRLAPGHQAQSFPGISAAWRISQEGWFVNSVKFVNELKLRASYGKLGNAQLGALYTNNYPSIAVLSSGNAYPFNNVNNAYFFQSSLPSDGLGWETVATSNIALDFALLSNRLTGSVEYYKKVNDNVAIVLPQPATLGVTPSTTNAAGIEVKGWDVNLAWKDRIGKVGYNVSLNVSDNVNTVTRYGGNVVYAEGTNLLPGYSTNTILGYKILGFFQDANDVANSPKQFATTGQGAGDFKYLDANGDGVINGGVSTAANHGDLVNLGNTNPRYNFGINMGANYKGFDLSVFFQGTGKRSIIIHNQEAIPFTASYRNPLDNYRDNYWTPTHTDALFPRPLSGGGTNIKTNSFLVQNAAYIRLKSLQVGYTLPVKWLSKVKMQNMRLFFSGQDLWTKTKMTYKYFDPESPNNALYTYPYAATYSFGVNVTF